MSKVYSLLPKLTVNEQFINEFISAQAPCFALGLVEERKRQCGFLALRPNEVIPPEVSSVGFRFGHSLLGTADFEVVHFAFEFYGFEGSVANLVAGRANVRVDVCVMPLTNRKLAQGTD
jgi:hypothetical protein